jgi:hypothetical protein
VNARLAVDRLVREWHISPSVAVEVTDAARIAGWCNLYDGAALRFDPLLGYYITGRTA